MGSKKRERSVPRRGRDLKSQGSQHEKNVQAVDVKGKAFRLGKQVRKAEFRSEKRNDRGDKNALPFPTAALRQNKYQGKIQKENDKISITLQIRGVKLDKKRRKGGKERRISINFSTNTARDQKIKEGRNMKRRVRLGARWRSGQKEQHIKEVYFLYCS